MYLIAILVIQCLESIISFATFTAPHFYPTALLLEKRTKKLKWCHKTQNLILAIRQQSYLLSPSPSKSHLSLQTRLNNMPTDTNKYTYGNQDKWQFA